jgi:hypothetical protein
VVSSALATVQPMPPPPPAADTGSPAAAPVGMQSAAGSSSSICAMALPATSSGAVHMIGASSSTAGGMGPQRSPAAPATPAPLPGVAGLFLQLSERRSPGSTVATSPLPPAGIAIDRGAEHAGSNSSSSRQSWPQSCSTSSGGGVVGGRALGGHVPRQALVAPRNSEIGRAAHEGGRSRGAGPPTATDGGASAAASGGSRPQYSASSVPAAPKPSPAGPLSVTRAIRVGKECVVCMEARSCVVQLPCGHLCCCEACTELLVSRAPECPMCRSQVTGYVVL